MQTHHLIAGTPEWHTHRNSGQYWNASDAPAMLGCSPYTTRSELLRKMHTGMGAEVDASTQRRFDDGHRFEALARPLAEKIIGDDLAPVVGTEGRFSASFDGLTLMGDTAFEHKTLNDELRALPWDQGNGYYLPKQYRVQMEQQLLVSGAERVLFMASKWDGDALVEERHCWYASDPKLRAELIAGWVQFEQDLAAYVPPAASALEKIVAEPVESLPAPVIQVSGQLTLQDNFKVFEQRLRAFLENTLIREPKTDQDFADLDQQIKALKGAEAALDAAEGQMLAQIATVDSAKKTKDMLAKLVRDNRLMAEKLLASEKERRKGEIVRAGINALNTHFAELNERIGKPYMPASAGHADFAGAIKGLRSMDAMENAVSVLLATAKIEANRIEAGISKNLGWLRENAKDFTALFPDTGAIVLKAHDDLVALAQNRIQAHKDAEQKRLDAERETIRAEEQAKAEKAAREAQEAEDALVTSIWGNARRIEGDSSEYVRKAIGMFESGAKDWANDPRPRVAGAVAAAREEMKGKLDAALAREAAAPAPTPEPAVIASPTVVSGPAPGVLGGPIGTPVAANVVPMGTRPPAAPSALPPLKLGDINARLQHISVNEAGLAALGFTATKVKGACMYAEADWGRMCDSIVAQVRAAQHQQLQAA